MKREQTPITPESYADSWRTQVMILLHLSFLHSQGSIGIQQCIFEYVSLRMTLDGVATTELAEHMEHDEMLMQLAANAAKKYITSRYPDGGYRHKQADQTPTYEAPYPINSLSDAGIRSEILSQHSNFVLYLRNSADMSAEDICSRVPDLKRAFKREVLERDSQYRGARPGGREVSFWDRYQTVNPGHRYIQELYRQ